MDIAAEQPSSPEAPSRQAAEDRPQCRFHHMRLRVGDRVHLAPPSHTGIGRLASTVVGWVEGQSLIVTTPHTAAGRLCLHAGEIVVVRAFTGRSAYAFRCTVLTGGPKACDYLYLSFPDVIDHVDVRNSPRFRIGIPARVSVPESAEPVQAVIDNIGTTGALLVCPTPLGEVGDSLQVAFDLVLHEIPVSLALQADIRSAEQGADGQHRHGVAFVEPAPNDRLILAALVWFNMYENPKLSA